MKNKLTDLNDHLFAQMERLSEEDLDEKTMEREIKRGHALANVAKQIIDNGRLVLSAHRLRGDGVLTNGAPGMLGLDHKPLDGKKHQ